MCDEFTREDIPEEELLLDTGKWIIDQKISFWRCARIVLHCDATYEEWKKAFEMTFYPASRQDVLDGYGIFTNNPFKQMTGNDRRDVG